MKEDYKLTKTEKAIVDLVDLQIVGKPFKDYMFDQYIKTNFPTPLAEKSTGRDYTEVK